MEEQSKDKSDLPKLSAPAERALAQAGYTRLQQLTRVPETELARLHGMGPNALDRLRAALKARGLSFVRDGGSEKGRIRKLASPLSRTDKVDEFMDQLKHPFKREVQVLRGIIKGVDQNITEQIKWQAPSFSYQAEYLVTFNLRDQSRIHLIFHHPQISKVRSKLLEGVHENRRMTYFASLSDIRSKKSTLEKVIEDLIKFQEI